MNFVSLTIISGYWSVSQVQYQQKLQNETTLVFQESEEIPTDSFFLFVGFMGLGVLGRMYVFLSIDDL